MLDDVYSIILIVIGSIIFVGLFGLIIAFPIKWCWNYTIPTIFGLDTITWGQAWCLNFLTSCLIKATQTNTNK